MSAELGVNPESATLIPLLSAGTFDMLPHVKALGETVVGAGYFFRQRETAPKYMRLYIGESESVPLHETGNAPGALQEVYAHAAQGAHPYLIEVTLGGSGLVDYNSETYRMQPGDLCFIDCRMEHFCRTEPGAESWHKLWLYVAGPCVERFYKAFLNSNMRKCRASLPKDSRIIETIRAVYDLYAARKPDAYADMRAAALITGLLEDCIDAARAGDTGRQTPAIMRQIQEYITQNYQERITLETLASRYSLDKYYLQKLFTQHAGISPNEYLIATRMHRAKEMLCTTQMLIVEVAEAVGIGNTSYFIKQFRIREGMTPAKYRQMMRPVSQKTRIATENNN